MPAWHPLILTRRLWVGALQPSQPSQARCRSCSITIVRQLVEEPRPDAHSSAARRNTPEGGWKPAWCVITHGKVLGLAASMARHTNFRGVLALRRPTNSNSPATIPRAQNVGEAVGRSLTIEAARAGDDCVSPVAGRMFRIANGFSLHSGPRVFQEPGGPISLGHVIWGRR
jgi:hypothetical protein